VVLEIYSYFSYI